MPLYKRAKGNFMGWEDKCANTVRIEGWIVILGGSIAVSRYRILSSIVCTLFLQSFLDEKNYICEDYSRV